MKSWQLKNNINHFELHQKKDNQITKDMVQHLMPLKAFIFFFISMPLKNSLEQDVLVNIAMIKI